MSKHNCYAMGCKIPITRRHLMCRRHWGMVPYDTYRDMNKGGDAKPWGDACREARDAVREVETP